MAEFPLVVTIDEIDGTAVGESQSIATVVISAS